MIRSLFLSILLVLPGFVLAQQSPRPQAVILQYHHIGTDTPPVTSLSLPDFRTHMEYLRDNDFEILPLEHVIAALRDGSPLPERSAVLTFDDGYLSVYEKAFPLLRELDFPFTVFVTAGLVSGNSALYASWEQLREMGEHGATLANHTMSHPYLLDREAGQSDREWLAWVEGEITGAEARIERETGQSHKLLAYPYGEYDPAIQQLVTRLGYTGLGQHSGALSASSDFTALPRFPFSGIYASMNTFPTKVNSLAFDYSQRVPVSPLTDEKRPAAELEIRVPDTLGALNCFNNNEPMELTIVDSQAGRVRIVPTSDNRSRRFRYNCTQPGRDGRFYWLSVPWVNTDIRE